MQRHPRLSCGMHTHIPPETRGRAYDNGDIATGVHFSTIAAAQPGKNVHMLTSLWWQA